MKVFMRYIATGSISFTFSTTFYLLFSLLGIFSPINEQMVINMLYLSIAIMSSIYLMNLLPIENPFILWLLEPFSVLLVLLLAGSIFNMFPLTLYNTFFVMAIGILTYIMVIIVIFMGEQANARRINTVIQKRKLEGLNE